MSRTGIHGGIRRGSAAAAIGAVLVLATGVPASQATEGTPDSGDPAASLSLQDKNAPAASSQRGDSERVRQDAPAQKPEGKTPRATASGQATAPGPSAAASGSAVAVPPALLPAVSATLAPSSTAVPTTTAAPSAGPTAGAPTASGSTTTTPIAGAASGDMTTPGSAPVATSPVVTPTQAANAADPGSVPGNLSATGKDQPATGGAAGEAPPAGTAAGAGQAPAAPLSSAPYSTPYSAAEAQTGWTSYAGAEGSAPRSDARLASQPEPRRAMVWLGSGLVGVAGAAGLVLFRLRNP